MIQETEQEMTRIREALLPAADVLKSVANSIPLNPSFNKETRVDLEKINTSAEAFRREADILFPAGINLANEADPGERLKKARHDARNRLNPLFNLVQLLGISEDFPNISEGLGNLTAHMEQCLKILSSNQMAPVPATASNPAPLAKEIERHPNPGVVLIVDDQQQERDDMARLLTPAGHELHFAEDGVEAIEKINTTLFDAVLLDIKMPKMDGFEVLAKLRESGHLRQTPVIVVTGLDDVQEQARCIEIGAEDFITRPIISHTLLIARLNASLEKKRLREQVFEQHFTPELARELARNPDPMKMQARHEEVSLLFCDIRRFSTISEELGPTQTVDWLSSVMGEFSTIVIDHGGVLVDYTGDEVMAMWGAPTHQPNHAELACSAALAILESLVELNKKWQPIVGAVTEVGIGVNTGGALVGNIGTHKKFKYGPLGTCVNLASRVQGATKYLKTPLLITGNTAKHLPETFRCRRLCQVKVINIKEPVDLYELNGKGIDQDWSDHAEKYEQALDLYENNEQLESLAMISRLLVESRRTDSPSIQLMNRVSNAVKNEDSPGYEFSPIWELEGK